MNNNSTFPWMLGFLALYSNNVMARGGSGSGYSFLLLLDTGIIFGIIFGMAALGMWLNKTYPSLFPTIGGLAVMLGISHFAAIILSAIGLVPNEYIIHAMVILALGLLFGPAINNLKKNP